MTEESIRKGLSALVPHLLCAVIIPLILIFPSSGLALKGKVTSIHADVIEMDIGSEKGINIGDTGRVYYTITISGEVKSIYVAKFKVTHISPNSCMARIEDKTGEMRVGLN
jgi:hypothetical protein